MDAYQVVIRRGWFRVSRKDHRGLPMPAVTPARLILPNPQASSRSCRSRPRDHCARNSTAWRSSGMRCIARTPLVVTPMQAVSAGPGRARGRSCRSPLLRASIERAEATDHARWLRALRGDPNGFSEIYDRYADRVLGYTLRQTGSWERARDVVSTAKSGPPAMGPPPGSRRLRPVRGGA